MGQSTPQPNDVGRNNPVALGIICLVVIEAPLKLSALGWPLTRGFVLLWVSFLGRSHSLCRKVNYLLERDFSCALAFNPIT